MALPFSSKRLEQDLEMWAAAAGISSRKAA
jgi:hypothetical protein